MVSWVWKLISSAVFVSGDDPLSFFSGDIKTNCEHRLKYFPLAEQDINYRFLCDGFFPPLAMISAVF